MTGSPVGYPAQYPHYMPPPFYGYGSPHTLGPWTYHTPPPQSPHTPTNQQFYPYPATTEAHDAEYAARPRAAEPRLSTISASSAVPLASAAAAAPPFAYEATALTQPGAVTAQIDGQTASGVDQLIKTLGLNEHQRASLAQFLAASKMN
jgi:hypothetical protein